MPKVTVIIPCFNSAPFIGQALESITAQTFNDIEIICVNDGSTDNTSDIIREYQLFDHRIHLIEQSNLGALEARRAGIKASSGEFICSLDSDDWLDYDALEIALQCIDTKDADIVLFNIKAVLSGKIVRSQEMEEIEWPLNGHSIISHTIGGWNIHGSGLYKKTLLLEAYEKFDNYYLDSFNNDDFLTRLAFFMSDSIDHVNVNYYARLLPESLTRKFKPQWMGYLDTLEATRDFLEKNGLLNALMTCHLKECITTSDYLESLWFLNKHEMTTQQYVNGIKRINIFRSNLPKLGLLRYALKTVKGLRIKIRFILIILNSYSLARKLITIVR
jgi:glycosyltransferase involved in cell wall biosynthesis